MKVVLPRNLEDYVTEMVQTGGYTGPVEVVVEALTVHQARWHGVEVVMTLELERLLDEGLEKLDYAHPRQFSCSRSSIGPSHSQFYPTVANIS